VKTRNRWAKGKQARSTRVKNEPDKNKRVQNKKIESRQVKTERIERKQVKIKQVEGIQGKTKQFGGIRGKGKQFEGLQGKRKQVDNERVAAYIDGFNLYFGLRSAGWKRFYWLNVQKLAQNLLKTGQALVFTKYFTSRVSQPADKERRQSTFLDALGTLKDLKLNYGHFQANPEWCRKCGNKTLVPNEKMTDVNIAVEMMSDAYQDLFDVAILISADSDLSAPVSAIKKLFPDKRVIVAFPPHRHSAQLERLAHSSFQIGRATIAKSVFPDHVPKADGFVLKKPDEWK